MLALFRNPLLRLLGRLWWLPTLTLVAAWGVGGEGGLWMAGLGAAAYIAAIVSMIGAAWGHGAYVALRESARHHSSCHRFLCPDCLHFGGFDFGCGACGKKVEAFLVHTNGAYINDCPHCRARLFTRDGLNGRSVRTYCEHCKSNRDCATHHYRRVFVMATLLPADFATICQTIGAQERSAQGRISYDCDDDGVRHYFQLAPVTGNGVSYARDDDGVRLTYLLNLESLTDTARALPDTHALWELKSIWLDAAGNEIEVALKMGEAADRFDRQTGLAKTLTVCVPQIELGDAVKNVLETRFKGIEYEVAAADFLDGRNTMLAAPKKRFANCGGDSNDYNYRAFGVVWRSSCELSAIEVRAA